MPRRLTSRRLRIISSQWTPDGKEIVYAGGTLGKYRVFRVAADGRSEPREVVEAKTGVESLAMPRLAHRLIVGRWETTSNLWRLDFVEPGGAVLRRKKAAESTDAGSFSPDGKLIMFVSDRSGELQVWLADADGLLLVRSLPIQHQTAYPRCGFRTAPAW